MKLGDEQLPKFNVVIPSRYASSRLPGKPLLDIHGKPMVIRVAEQAQLSGAERVVVATDDQRIYEAVRAHQFEVVMTSASHQSGTDRIAEVVEFFGWADDVVVVNVQGDEPLIEPAVICQVAKKLSLDKESVMSTACFPIVDPADFFNPNVVKVVMDEKSRALYFSRAPIPYPRDAMKNGSLQPGVKVQAYRHIGLYAYRAGFLKRYSTLPASSLEQIESLEQLRVLQSGYQIVLDTLSSTPSTGVDTPEDLEKVRVLFPALCASLLGQ